MKKKKNVHKQCLMDFITGPGSSNKEQGEKSCIVAHNNIIFIDKLILFYKQYLFVMLLRE